GTFKITDKSGKSATISTVGLKTLDDVVSAINGASISVTATITDTGLKLSDYSGGSGQLAVIDLDSKKTGTSLGIVQATSTNTIPGSDIAHIGLASKVQQLNDGRGIRTASGNDIRITLADTSTIDVDLSSATTLNQVVNAINNAASSKVTASIDTITNA